MHVSVSILACNLLNIENSLRAIQAADSIHFDVMDGHFVDNISFGTAVCKSICKTSKIPVFAHLMVDNPEKQINNITDIGLRGISFHPSNEADAKSILTKIKSAGLSAGLAVFSEKEIDVLYKCLDIVNHIVFMTVEPGACGQNIINEQLKKMKKLSDFLKNDTLIFADGGINVDTYKRCVSHGCNAVISGSYIFAGGSPENKINSLRG